jgi:hypothetical protein
VFEILKPSLICAKSLGNIVGEQFCSHKRLRHAATGYRVEKASGIAQQNDARRYACPCAACQRRDGRQFRDLFRSFES